MTDGSPCGRSESNNLSYSVFKLYSVSDRSSHSSPETVLGGLWVAAFFFLSTVLRICLDHLPVSTDLLHKTLKPINAYHCLSHRDATAALVDQDQISRSRYSQPSPRWYVRAQEALHQGAPTLARSRAPPLSYATLWRHTAGPPVTQKGYHYQPRSSFARSISRSQPDHPQPSRPSTPPAPVRARGASHGAPRLSSLRLSSTKTEPAGDIVPFFPRRVGSSSTAVQRSRSQTVSFFLFFAPPWCEHDLAPPLPVKWHCNEDEVLPGVRTAAG